MNCCPSSIRDLGCFSACENVPLAGLSLTGAKLVTTFNGRLHTITGDFNGQIPTATLNEDYTYVVQFYDSQGDVVVIGGFDGFRFTLQTPI
jgi:hypothetical protein